MADKTDTALADYEVTIAREIKGAYRAVGDTVALTPGQAKYYLPPLGTGLKKSAEPKAAATKPAPPPATKPATTPPGKTPPGKAEG